MSTAFNSKQGKILRSAQTYIELAKVITQVSTIRESMSSYFRQGRTHDAM